MFPNLTFTLEGGSSFSSNIKCKEPECLRPPSRPGMMHAAVSTCMCGCVCVCDWVCTGGDRTQCNGVTCHKLQNNAL